MGRESDLNHNFPHSETISRLLPGPERIRENVFVSSPITGPPCGTVSTVYEVLRRGAALSENGPCLGDIKDGKYEWISYQKVIDESVILGRAMLAVGVEPRGRVGIAGIHSVRYITAMHGMGAFSLTIVPLYHNSKLETLCEIANVCNLQLILCDTVARAAQFIEEKQNGKLESLKTLVILEDSTYNSTVEKLQVLSYEQFRELGTKGVEIEVTPSADDVYLICHTSGTTGTPKGVQMTHRNLLAAMAGLYTQWVLPPNRFHFDSEDAYFSFLSLAHVYEHLMETFALYIGAKIGIYSGDVTKLLVDIQALHPTIVSLVPRLLNKFYERVHGEISKKGFLVQKLFNIAKNQKLKMLHNGVQRYDTIWDTLVFNKLRPLFGGNLRMITTGGAPVTDAVKDFTRIAYGCPLMEGYGQTECGAAGTLNLPFEYKSGVVGGPAPWAQVKLVDVPELEYYASNDKGEICFRGAAVMKGYFNDPELSAKTVDSDGWLHTGDVGQWMPNGALAVIDRKNALFKLAQGDFVSPEQIEAVYLNSSLLSQIFVTGRSTRSFLVAVVLPNYANLRSILSEHSELASLCKLSDDEVSKNKRIEQLLLSELNISGKRNGLQTIELIQAVSLVTQEWTAENGLVTPTLKLRRHLLRDKFASDIEAMFSSKTHV